MKTRVLRINSVKEQDFEILGTTHVQRIYENYENGTGFGGKFSDEKHRLDLIRRRNVFVHIPPVHSTNVWRMPSSVRQRAPVQAYRSTVSHLWS